MIQSFDRDVSKLDNLGIGMLNNQHIEIKHTAVGLTYTPLQCSSYGIKHHPINRKKGLVISASPTVSLEDLALRVAQERDKNAFKELFSHFAPRVKSFLLKQKVADSVADDLTQEVMVTVWEKARLFDPAKARLSTWIFRIARNKFIDKIRRQKYIEVDADDHIHTMTAPEKTDEPALHHQDQKRIMSALGTLKPELRVVIELSFYRELSHSEIAATLSLPLGTVKSRIRIAFQRLRLELGDF
jgi:RNA polymerase sigma-70 factor (ECF subfamily)